MSAGMGQKQPHVIPDPNALQIKPLLWCVKSVPQSDNQKTSGKPKMRRILNNN